MILVDKAINSGKPSIKDADGAYATVKQIYHFVNGGLTIEETMEELKLSRVQVLAALEYAKTYPQILI